MTKYNEEMLNQCVEWVKENGIYPQKGGAPLCVFCDAMGIDDDTYYEWRKKAEFSEAIKKANMAFASRTTHEAVNALKRKAFGYEITVTEQEAKPRRIVYYDPKTGRKAREEQGELTTAKASKKQVVVAPDTAALIFLLTNLSPEEWKNYQRADIVADVNVKQPRDLTPEEAAALQKHLEENY